MATRTRSRAIKPKSIDIYARMTIVRGADDLDGIAEGGDVPAALAPKVAVKKKKFNLPTPDVMLVEGYGEGQPAPYVPPTGYVRSSSRPFGHDSPAVSYTADGPDRKWLQEHPKFSGPDGAPLSVEHFELIVFHLEELVAQRGGTLPESEARVQLNQSLSGKITKLATLLSDVYKYWDRKRRKLGKPLLRTYWPQTGANDLHPHSVFRPREKEGYNTRRSRRNDLETYRKLDAVRADLTAAQDILTLLRKREGVKAALLGATMGGFQAAVAATVGGEAPPVPPAARRGAVQALLPAAVQVAIRMMKSGPSPDEIARGSSGSAATVRSRTVKRRRSDMGTARTRGLPPAVTPATGPAPKEVPAFSVGGWRLPANAPAAVINPLLPPVANTAPVTSMCGFSADPADLGSALGVSLGHELSEGTWQALQAGVALPVCLPVSAALKVRDAVAAASSGQASVRDNLEKWLADDPDVQLEAQTQAVRLMTVRNTLGRAAGGGAWEDAAGLALGLGAVGAIGEGWTAAGQSVQAGPPPMPVVGEDAPPPSFLLRPRLGRGSRLVLDRLPLTAATRASSDSAGALLRTRKAARALARRIAAAAGATPAPPAAGCTRGPPVLSSAMPTHMASGHAGDATDAHAARALALGLPTTHGLLPDGSTETTWLAPSRYRPASLPVAVADVLKHTALPRADATLAGKGPGSAGGGLASGLDTRQAGIVAPSAPDAALEVAPPPGLLELGCPLPPPPSPRTPPVQGHALDGVHMGFGAAVHVGRTAGASGVALSCHTSHDGLLPRPAVASGVTLKRLGDVYAMEDSDDDDLVQVAFADHALFSRSAHDA